MMSSYFFIGGGEWAWKWVWGWEGVGACFSLPVCVSIYVFSTSIKSACLVASVQVRARLCCCGLPLVTLLRMRIPSMRAESQASSDCAWALICQVLTPQRMTDVSFCLLAPSYIPVTCPYVIQDKVLQSGFSFIKLSSCSSLCVSVCVPGREIYTRINSGQEKENHWAHVVSSRSTSALQKDKCQTKVWSWIHPMHFSCISCYWFEIE